MKTGPEPQVNVARVACASVESNKGGEDAKALERLQEHNLLGRSPPAERKKCKRSKTNNDASLSHEEKHI